MAEQRHATPERIIIKPTLGNVLLWRSIAVEKGTLQADAIRVGLPNNVNIYPGTQARLIDLTEYEDLPPDSRAYRDLHRFYQLADHMLVQHPERSNFIGDVRYSMLPNSIYPMWGIVIDREDPDAITAFVVERDTSPSVRAALVRMLKGE